MRSFVFLRATVVAAILLFGWFGGTTAHAQVVEDDSYVPPDPYASVAHDLEAGQVISSSVQGVFGTDDRVQVAQTTAAPYSMVTFILTEWSDGSVSSCSGFMVGPHTVGTAGHCVFDRSERLGWAKRVLVSPGANGTQKPYGTFWATSVASVAGWTQASRTSSSVDFAAITLASDVGTTTGTFGLAAESDAALQAGSFTVAGYPGDKSSASLWSASGPIDGADSGLVYFRLDVTHGNSGGPIWEQTSSGPSVIGLVEGGSSTTNIGVRMSQPVIDRYRSWAGGGSADTPSIAPNTPSSIAPPTPRTLSASPSSLAAPTGHSAYSVLQLGAAEGSGDLVLRSSGGTLNVDGLLSPLSCAGGTKVCVGVTGSGTGSVTIPDTVNDLSSLVITLAGTVVRETTVIVTATQGTGSSPWQLSIPVTVKADSTLGVSAGSGRITSGSIPSTGIGLAVFDGGTSEQLVAASGCPTSSAVFWVADGVNFITYVPGVTISSVNAAWTAKFGAEGIPSGTVIIGRCR